MDCSCVDLLCMCGTNTTIPPMTQAEREASLKREEANMAYKKKKKKK